MWEWEWLWVEVEDEEPNVPDVGVGWMGILLTIAKGRVEEERGGGRDDVI